VPRPVAGALAAASETAWRVLPLPGRPPITRLAYWLASQECTIDIARARRELGYIPVISVDQGLEELRST
jgi:nucleoside-diphosphate-sugar epimerase